MLIHSSICFQNFMINFSDLKILQKFKNYLTSLLIIYSERRPQGEPVKWHIFYNFAQSSE